MAEDFWREAKVSGTTLIPWVYPATLSRYDVLREGANALSTEVARAAPFQEAAAKARKLAWAGARQEIVTWATGIGTTWSCLLLLRYCIIFFSVVTIIRC
jgi:hypothetical protein